VLDSAVLTAGVHRLEHDQQAASVLGVQPSLQVANSGTVPVELGPDMILVLVVFGLGRIDIREPDGDAGLDAVARVVRLWRWSSDDALWSQARFVVRRPV
jgi:hypothetical protein